MANEPIPSIGAFKNPHLSGVNAFGSGDESGGIVKLLNSGIQIIFLIAGIYAFFNIAIAGFMFINARGDAKQIESAWYKIWQSMAGLAIVIISFIAAVVLGQVFFGNPGAILNLELTAPK